ncbi:MAG TPA: IPT/TIG domain-containing protein [Bryobacteraceae bacterium]|jgi:uncharacterized protein (TIGR03437 family)
MKNRAAFLALALLGVAHAQTYSNATLNTKYYFRELYFSTDATGNPTDVRSAVGAIIFDGKGNYSVNATQNLGIANAAQYTANGTYSVASNASFTMVDPLRSTLTLNARYGAEAIFGSTSDASDNTFAFFIAVPEPSGGYTVKSLSGPYFVSTFELTGASASTVRSALLMSMQPDGKGNVPGFNMNGHAANVNGGRVSVEFNQGGTYTVNSDGSGALNFGSVDPTKLISGSHPIYISKSGNIFIGGSTDPGVQDILIGIRGMPTSPAPTNTSFSGGYFTAGLRLQVDPTNPTSSCYTGGLNSNGIVSLFTRRLRQAAVPNTFTFTGSQTYAVGSDASVAAGDYAAGLGVSGLFVESEVSSAGDNSGYEIDFGSAYPQFSGSGVFISPYGVVNAASNAPGGSPLSPGEFVTVYGSNLAGSTLQAGAPYPLTLGGVTVTVNNVPAPIYLVSANQINFLVPFAVTGSTANIVVKNATGTSNTVSLPLAATSPGIYSVDLSGAGYGVILHADYSLVSPSSPASQGETVLVYLTGLGAVKPAVADGVAAPSSPLSNVALTSQQLQVYMDGQPAAAQFAGLAPGFPGLYQINVTIPKNLSSTGQVDVAINTPDAFHDQIYLYVQ